MKTNNWPSALLLSLIIAATLPGCGRQPVEKQLQHAREYVAKGEKKAAIIELKNLLAEHPENAQARLLLGQLYLETGEADAASIELKKAVEHGADKIATTVTLVKAQLARGEAAKALALLDPKQLPEAASAPQLMVLRAQALADSGKPDEAAQTFQAAQQRDPKFADAPIGLAKLALRQQKPDEAMKVLDAVLAQAPNNAEALILKGDLLRIKGDAAGAKAAFRQAVAADKNNSQGYLGQIALAIDGRQTAEARQLLTELQKIAPNNIFARHFNALVLLQEKKPDQALTAVLEVLKAAPGFPAANLLAANIEMSKGADQQAMTHLNVVLAKEPNNLAAQRLQISAWLKQGEADKAAQMVVQMLDKHPDDATVLGLAGEVFARKKDYSKSMGYFSRAAQIDPNNSMLRTRLALSRMAGGDAAHAMTELAELSASGSQIQPDILLALAHINKGEWAEAEKAIAQIQKKQPDNPIGRGLRSSVLLGKQDVAGARKELEAALQEHPDYIPAAVNLARLDLNERKPELAQQRFDKLMAKQPRNVELMQVYADFLLQQGKPADAGRWLEKARQLQPDAMRPLLTLTAIALQAKDNKRALELAQAGVAAHPDDQQALDNLGNVQLLMGEKNQSLATYAKLVKLHPKSAPAHFRLAYVQSQSGDSKAAIDSLKTTLALAPGNADAYAALTALYMKEGKSGDAVQLTQALQKQQPKAPLGFLLEGDVQMQAKKYPEAAAMYRRAAELGDSGLIATKRHRAEKLAGNANAEATLLKWLEKHPQEANVWLYLAEDALRDKRFKVAAAYYESAGKLVPGSALVLNNLAYVYQQLRDPRAQATAELALKQAPDNPSIMDTLAMIMIDSERVAPAIDLLNKALARNQGDLNIRFHLAQAYVKTGEHAKARQELESVIQTGQKFDSETEARSLLRSLSK